MKVIKNIIYDIFVISFLTYVVYLALEFIFEGFVSNYFDLNILLVLVIVSGFLVLFWDTEKNML